MRLLIGIFLLTTAFTVQAEQSCADKPDTCLDYDLDCMPVGPTGKFCCGKKEEEKPNPPAQSTEKCPDGENAFKECGDKPDECYDFDLECVSTASGKKYCCGEKKPDDKKPDDKDDQKCPDDKPAVMDCQDDTECKKYNLQCSTVGSHKFCCKGEDKPPEKPQEPAENAQGKCPDGENAFVSCASSPDQCLDYDLECLDAEGGAGKFCCGKKPEDDKPETKPTDNNTGEKCPDGENAFKECSEKPDECYDFDLECLPTASGKKYCCGSQQPKPDPSKDDKNDQKCPDGKPAVMDCTSNAECKQYNLQCKDVGSLKFCCKGDDQPDNPDVKPPTQADGKCPDGENAFVSCADSSDKCLDYDLECLDVENAGKFCCGKKPEDEEKPDPPTTNTEKCPDGENAMKECDTNPDQCLDFDLECLPTASGKKYCCGSEQPKPDPGNDDKADQKCPDGKPAVMDCKDNSECKEYKLECKDVGSLKFCCKGDEQPENPDVKPPTEPENPDVKEPEQPDQAAGKCPDGENAFVSCADSPDKCLDYDLECLDVEGGVGKFCCGKKPEEDKPETKPVENSDKCPDGENAMKECSKSEDCYDFDLDCLDVKGGKKYCCGSEQPKPDPGKDDKNDQKCPDGKPAVMDCTSNAECKQYNLQCNDIGSSKFCCKGDEQPENPDVQQPDKPTDENPDVQQPDKPTDENPDKPTDEETPQGTCPDDVNAFVSCSEDEEKCNDYDLKCMTVGSGKFCCGDKDSNPEEPEAGKGEPDDKKCPDGERAFVTCSDNAEKCFDYDLDCIEVEGGSKYCCGKKDDTDPANPDTDAKCPDGAPVVVDCTEDGDCADFKLKCKDVQGETKKYCCKGDDSDPENPEKTPPEQPPNTDTDPSNPGKTDPSNPGKTDPSNPGKTDPSKPNNPSTDCVDKLDECGKKQQLCTIPPYDRLVRKYCPKTCTRC